MSKNSVGRLVKRVVIEQPSHASDGMGGSTTTWATFVTSYAEINPISASERFFSQQLQQETTHKIRIRYRPGITTAMRVNQTIAGNTRYFQIHGILNEQERNRYLILLCQEGVGS